MITTISMRKPSHLAVYTQAKYALVFKSTRSVNWCRNRSVEEEQGSKAGGVARSNKTGAPARGQRIVPFEDRASVELQHGGQGRAERTGSCGVTTCSGRGAMNELTAKVAAGGSKRDFPGWKQATTLAMPETSAHPCLTTKNCQSYVKVATNGSQRTAVTEPGRDILQGSTRTHAACQRLLW